MNEHTTLDLEEIFLLPYQKITAYTSYDIFAYYLGLSIQLVPIDVIMPLKINLFFDNSNF